MVELAKAQPSVYYEVEWIETPANLELSYTYGQVRISQMQEQSILDNGFFLRAPYKASDKPLRLRIVVELEGKELYAITKAYGREIDIDASGLHDDWFDVKVANKEDTSVNVSPAQLQLVDSEFYHISFINRQYLLASKGSSVDFVIDNANTQNKNLLLLCNPGNVYLHPSTGIGLSYWVNSTVDIKALGERLQSEYTADGTPVKDARYDFENSKLYLVLDTDKADEDGQD